MKTDINIGLQGAFKVDLFSGGKFVESTDWFSNFITPTGLYYPNIYPFVDCFRFLSLGTDSSTPNSGAGYPGSSATGLGTTGLAAPMITGFNTSFGPQSGVYIGWQGYENGSDNSQSACGTILTEQGPRFYRAWSIPTGGVNYTMQNTAAGLTINEFMVSPSSGSNITGNKAFSRVRRTVTIPNGYSAIISYQLSINLQNTGLTYFAPGTFTINNADITSSPDDGALVTGWGNLSGYYRHVYHGLNVIDSAGAHFTPSYGCGMEPYLTDLSQYCFYLSPDNSAFDVSTTGSSQSNSTGAYKADGLMGTLFGLPMTAQQTATLSDSLFYGQVPQAQSVLGGQSITTPKNIRIGMDGLFSIPSVSGYNKTEDFGSFNYQSTHDASQEDISYATPGILGNDSTKVDYKQKAIFSTRIFKQPMDMTGGIPQNLITGRSKTITRKTLFSPVSSLGYNTRFGSLVFASNLAPGTSDNSIYFPMVDTLFFNTAGRSLMQHYRLIKIYLDNRGTGVADSYISIYSSGNPNYQGNINRYFSRKTFQGPYDSVDGDPQGFDRNNAFMSGATSPALTSGGGFVAIGLTGYSDPNNKLGQASAIFHTNGSSGWGMVYGVVADDATYHNQPYDCGLFNHNIISGVNGLQVTNYPTGTELLYWPSPDYPLTVNFTGLRYYSTGTCWGGAGSSPLASGAGTYNWSTNPCKFCPPTGHIVHYENIGVSGFRLLPNHGYPNNNVTDFYLPTTGGSYPGLSFDNGIELYFNINWNSPCPPGTPNCL